MFGIGKRGPEASGTDAAPEGLSTTDYEAVIAEAQEKEQNAKEQAIGRNTETDRDRAYAQADAARTEEHVTAIYESAAKAAHDPDWASPERAAAAAGVLGVDKLPEYGTPEAKAMEKLASDEAAEYRKKADKVEAQAAKAYDKEQKAAAKAAKKADGEAAPSVDQPAAEDAAEKVDLSDW